MVEGHHTRLKDQEINCCVYGVPPSSVYKGVEEGVGWPHRARPKGGILLLLGVGSPFPSPTRRGKEGEEGEKESPSRPIRIGLGGARLPLGHLLLSSTKAREGPLTPRGFR